MKRVRPHVITMLAMLHAVSAGAIVWIAISAPGAQSVGVRAVIAILFPFEVATVVGLWTLKPYCRALALPGMFSLLMAFPLGTAVGGLWIWYFYRPGVKALFSSKSVAELTDDERMHLAAIKRPGRAMMIVFVAVFALSVLGVLSATYKVVRPSH
jgi:hypothetical protein